MAKNLAELRERAANDELSESDVKYLNDRKGIPVYDAIREVANTDVILDDEDDEDEGYASWTNDELREELGRRELETSGNKADLVARLEESDNELEVE
jgi:hypothetical protein